MKNNSVVADIVANQRKLERKRWFVPSKFAEEDLLLPDLAVGSGARFGGFSQKTGPDLCEYDSFEKNPKKGNKRTGNVHTSVV